MEKNETSLQAAYRELSEETGILENDITPLLHMIDFVYHNTGRIVEFYVGTLQHEVDLVPEAEGNSLEWLPVNGTDFSDEKIFAGDGNIWHCFLMTEKSMIERH